MNANRGNAGGQLATIRPADGSVLSIGELMERIIAVGDLGQLRPEDRAHYLVRLAEGIGLNPMSQPFDLIPGQNGELRPYLNKSGTDQLRKLYRLRTNLRSAKELNGVYMVEVEVTDGVRSESNIGAVSIKGLQGVGLQNALMKAHTKAKRRATLDWCGLGLLDEAEIEGLRDLGFVRAAAAPAVSEMPAAAAALGDGIPDADFADRMTGEVIEVAEIGQEIKAHLIATGRLHPDAPETLQSVKLQIQKLTGYGEWATSDLATVAAELGLPAWRELTLADAQTLRADVLRRIEEAEDDGDQTIGVDTAGTDEGAGWGEPEQDTFIDADSRIVSDSEIEQQSA